MADSEFGTGTNAEKVTQNFSLFYKSDTQTIYQKNEHNTWYICHEFSQSSSNPDRSTCADCDCAYLGIYQKLKFVQCSETHRYLCEYKGKVYIFIGTMKKPSNKNANITVRYFS